MLPLLLRFMHLSGCRSVHLSVHLPRWYEASQPRPSTQSLASPSPSCSSVCPSTLPPSDGLRPVGPSSLEPENETCASLPSLTLSDVHRQPETVRGEHARTTETRRNRVLSPAEPLVDCLPAWRCFRPLTSSSTFLFIYDHQFVPLPICPAVESSN